MSSSVIESDFLRRELQLQPHWVGETIGQVGQAHQQVQVHDLLIRKILLQRRDLFVLDLPRSARQFFRKLQRGFGLRPKLSALGFFQRLPVFFRQPGPLRRSEVVLQSIVAAVHHGHPYVHHLV